MFWLCQYEYFHCYRRCNWFSLLVNCQNNKHLNRNDLNFEGTFHLAGVCIVHLEEWQHVRAAKLIPRVAKTDSASSQHRLHPTCAPSVLNVTTNILQIRCGRRFVLPLSIWLGFFSRPPMESCNVDRLFALSNDHLPRFLEKLSLCPKNITVMENNSCWSS